MIKDKPGNDVRMSLTRAQLFDATGCYSFPFNFNAIRLRKTLPSSHIVPFHTDYSLETTQIPLQVGVGGQLTFITHEGIYQPDMKVGYSITHNGKVAHGVTALESGIRISLFLCQLPEDDIVDEVLEYFTFADRLRRWYDRKPDIQQVILDYWNRDLDQKDDFEVVNRSHMLSPVNFKVDKRLPYQVGQSMFQQRKFCLQMTEVPSRQVIMEWVDEFNMFMENRSTEEPSFGVDVIWHTRLQKSNYEEYCLERFGTFIDHLF